MSKLKEIQNNIVAGALDAAYKLSKIIQEHMPSSPKTMSHVEKVKNSKESQPEEGIGGI
jgi:hypothetical protein